MIRTRTGITFHETYQVPSFYTNAIAMGRKTEFTVEMNTFFDDEMDEYRAALVGKALKNFWPGFFDRFTDKFTLEDVVCNESKIKEVEPAKRQQLIRETKIAVSIDSLVHGLNSLLYFRK